VSEDAGQEPSSDAARPGALRDARTLRPGSAIGIGIAGGAAGLALLIPALLTSPRSWTLISSVTLGLVLLWLFVIRPCAVIHADGIRLVNPLRNVDLTWPAISEVRSRWALELLADGTRYTAWGVPADPGRPRYGRQLLTMPANRMRQKSSPEPEVKKAKVEAQGVAAEVEERIEADRKRQDGRTPRVAVQAWDPVSMGLLIAGVGFFVIGTFVV
jgi:hypothetical protein